MRRTLLALGGVALLATACGSSHRTTAPAVAPAATSVTAPPLTSPPTTSTTLPDTTVVPPKITVAYVDAVLVQLNHLYGDAVRATVNADKVTPAADSYLQAIYNKRLDAGERRAFAVTLADGLQNVRRVPGDPVTSVEKLVYASRSCIYARVTTNSNPALIHPAAPAADEFMGLIPRAAGHSINHTPWVLFFDGVTQTPADIPNQCPAA